MNRTLLFLVVCTAVTFGTAEAATIEVPKDQSTIQAGINAAAHGDRVLVSDGVYTGPGNTDIDFLGKVITVVSKNGAEKTIIDCAQSGRGFKFVSGEGPNTVLDGFNIMNGYVVGNGGAIFISGSSPTIRNNIITENFADGNFPANGGAIFCEYFSSPLIEKNIISWNLAYWWGGGISCYDNFVQVAVRGNTITDNCAMDGGGIHLWASDAAVGECTLAYNVALNTCGGIFVEYQSRADVDNSIVWDNMDQLGLLDLYAAATSFIAIDYSALSTPLKGPGVMGPSILFAYPMFVSVGCDYRLTCRSPCIDFGRPPALDPDGSPKDLGAFYYDQSKTIVTYASPDYKIVSRTGGILGVTYTFNNHLPLPKTFLYMTNVFLPQGIACPGNPILGPTSVTVASGMESQLYFAHPIPPIAPLGFYDYKVLAGTMPSTLYDLDRFSFLVNP